MGICGGKANGSVTELIKPSAPVDDWPDMGWRVFRYLPVCVCVAFYCCSNDHIST